MISVKLTTPDYPLVRENILRQTPDKSGKWGDFQFFLNDEIDKCDYWVVFENLPKNESAICSKENTLFIAAESSSIKKYNRQFLGQFSKIITCQRRIDLPGTYYMAPGHSWRPEKSYDELYKHNNIEKSKIISIVVSNKAFTPGHKKRLEFCLNLKKHFGSKIDIFGRGINEFNDKWDVLAPYKYSIAIENSVETDWMTEKIGDCFTSLTFPFYFGCPNINEYYNTDSYQLIDINDFEKSCTIIEKIINDENHYNQHLESLIRSKNKYINKFNLIPLIAGFISKYNITINKEFNYITIKQEIETFNIINLLKKFIKKIINHNPKSIRAR